jgi:hypothetical protein
MSLNNGEFLIWKERGVRERERYERAGQLAAIFKFRLEQWFSTKVPQNPRVPWALSKSSTKFEKS